MAVVDASWFGEGRRLVLFRRSTRAETALAAETGCEATLDVRMQFLNTAHRPG